VGPTPAGEIEPRQVERLREVGQWLTRYGESIYSTRGGPFRNGKWGGSTYRGKTIYLHVIDWGASRLDLPPLKAKITKWASLTGGKATLVQTASGIRIIMPVEGRDPVDTILRLDLDGPAMSEIPAGVPLAVPASNP
jgi:alpha-L-fucosidase